MAERVLTALGCENSLTGCSFDQPRQLFLTARLIFNSRSICFENGFVGIDIRFQIKEHVMPNLEK
jgi:hypothetical protein